MSVADGLMRRWRGLSAEPLALGIAFVVTLAVALLEGTKPFYYDSGGYWRLADTFVRDGTWSLLNFNNPIRGYAPSLFYGGLREVSYLFGRDQEAASAVVKVLNAGLFSVIGTVLAPRLAKTAWPQISFGIGRRLVMAALMLIFWHGYLSFPLTDFPALALALVALLAASRSSSLAAMLVAGFTASAAINFRPAFVLLVPAVIFLVLRNWHAAAPQHRPSIRRRGLSLSLIVVGLAVVAVPQALITDRNFDLWNPLPGAPAKLTSFQLSVGLKLQRYETFVGDERRPQMNYYDNNTTNLDADLGVDGTVSGYAAYGKLALEHPLTIAAVFGRHLINGIDQRYATPYIERLDTGERRPFRLAGLLIVFLGLLRIVWPAARRGLGQGSRWSYLVALSLTCLPTLPSAMEARFLLPLFTLTALLAVAPGWPPWAGLNRDDSGLRRVSTPAVIVVGLAAFLAVTLMVTAAATASLILS